MQELDELSFKFINEISSNGSALLTLNKVAEKKINILKDEHEKQNLVINVSSGVFRGKFCGFTPPTQN